MGLGSILGSISPAFGLVSGKGLFSKLPLNAMGQSGLGGILGMLLSHGQHGGGGGEPQAPEAGLSALHQGGDPAGGLMQDQPGPMGGNGWQAILQHLGILR